MFLYNNYINSKKQVHIKENGSFELLFEMTDFIRTLQDETLKEEITLELDAWLRIGTPKYQMLALTVIEILNWHDFKPTLQEINRYAESEVNEKINALLEVLETPDGPQMIRPKMFLYNNYRDPYKHAPLYDKEPDSYRMEDFIDELEDPRLISRIQEELIVWLKIGDRYYCPDALSIIRRKKWKMFVTYIEQLISHIKSGKREDPHSQILRMANETLNVLLETNVTFDYKIV